MNQKLARVNLLSISQIAIALFLNCICPFLKFAVKNGLLLKAFLTVKIRFKSVI